MPNASIFEKFEIGCAIHSGNPYICLSSQLSRRYKYCGISLQKTETRAVSYFTRSLPYFIDLLSYTKYRLPICIDLILQNEPMKLIAYHFSKNTTKILACFAFKISMEDMFLLFKNWEIVQYWVDLFMNKETKLKFILLVNERISFKIQ